MIMNYKQKIGCVIENKIEGFHTKSVQDCTFVAKHEFMLNDLQRKMMKITKLANLNTLVGDYIVFEHPHTKIHQSLLITKITRKFKPSGFSDEDGYFLDEIEGFVVGQEYVNKYLTL